MKQSIDVVDRSTHTISKGITYAVCLNLNLPSPDNPELIVMSGEALIAALESCAWREIPDDSGADE